MYKRRKTTDFDCWRNLFVNQWLCVCVRLNWVILQYSVYKMKDWLSLWNSCVLKGFLFVIFELTVKLWLTLISQTYSGILVFLKDWPFQILLLHFSQNASTFPESHTGMWVLFIRGIFSDNVEECQRPVAVISYLKLSGVYIWRGLLRSI